MTLAQTYAWIFYAIGLASHKEAVNYAKIAIMADGINHAVPTQKEMRLSLMWLESQNLIQKEGTKFKLNDAGSKLLQDASSSEKTTIGVWKFLQKDFSEIGADNIIQINPKTMNAYNII